MYWARTDSWYLERVIWLIAGSFTLAGTLLAWLHSPWWLLLTGLVGVNLLVFALSGFCVMANILHMLGIRSRIDRGMPTASGDANSASPAA